MAATYEPIASTTISGSAASTISFTSIPSDFTDLFCAVKVVPVTSGSGAVYLTVRLNNDSGSNYSLTQLYGTGSAAGSLRLSNKTDLEVEGSSFRNKAVFNVLGQVMSYTNTNVYKTSLWSSDRSDANVRRSICLWGSTSAINRLDLIVTGTNTSALDVGTTASLYGIKAA